MKWKIVAIAIVIVAILVGGFFFGRSLLKEKVNDQVVQEESYLLMANPRAALTPEGLEDQTRASVSEKETSVGSTFIASEPLSFEQRIVKSGSLDLRVEEGKLKDSVSRITALVESKGGFVQNSQFSQSEKYEEAYLIVIVPVSEFSSMMRELETFGEVVSNQSAGQDVTQEYHDLQLDLTHWEAERTTALLLLDKATTLDEIIKVRQFLEPIDRQINEIKGRLEYLKKTSDYSTIQVTLRQKGEIFVGNKEPTVWQKIWDLFLTSLTGSLAFLAAALPILALVALLVFLVWLALHKRKRPQPPTPTTPTTPTS